MLFWVPGDALLQSKRASFEKTYMKSGRMTYHRVMIFGAET